ncbi:MAG: phosphoribosylformylglycinamidine synthase subunit PurL, partial [Sulfuricurvum sp.]|nr:phosphoribosylformylglycinamidine synthase subunit PurL [Sulfuricurvum sp.]
MSVPLQDIEKVLKQHKLSQDDYAHIQKILGREPNLVEIGVFSAMWSEHCSYKSSKKHLSGFPTKAPWVIQGPGENAGVIDIGGGYAAVFKMESHNHPSFIEPYQGAATGVGGIMRDVFTMGARPIANLNALRFGNVTNKDAVSAHQRYLVRGVVSGIGGYGNCMGVPTIGGETSFDECYNGNILVNAFTLGLAKSDEIFYGRAEGMGNPVIYVGSKTGRDGLGGAVMSSDSFTEASKGLRPTVQVGDPFTEKLLLEACLELFKTDYVVGIQDMGAAGLTSSAFEMAGRSGSGMIMNLDKVPAREEGMMPYEFMLSESQERMLICARKGTEQAIIDIFEKWDLDCAVIGEVTGTGNMELFWHGEKCAEIPVDPVSEEAPVLDRPVSRPTYLDEIAKITLADFDTVDNQTAFEKLISSMEVVDKGWIYQQYDSMVQTNTIKKGGELDASVIRIKENGVALAMSADCNVRFCYIDPYAGAAAAVIESGR